MPARPIRQCMTPSLPPHLAIRAMGAAVGENRHNHPALQGPIPPGLHPAQLGALAGKTWEPGRTIGFRFLDGTKAERSRFQRYAEDWTKVIAKYKACVEKATGKPFPQDVR